MTWTNLGGQVRVGVRPAVTAQQLETATYLLNSYGGAAVAYSLRKLNSTYVGSAIRVRRSSDNSEMNIGFDGSGNLDIASLSSFTNPTDTGRLLDSYSGASVAYSLRKLSATWSGSAIRVRRSGDNAEVNIGFDAVGDLDTASLLSFVGYNNIALYSEEFDNVNWNKYITTVTSNQAIAPDGTMTADLLSEASANNYHTLSNGINLSFAVGTSWNVSLYIKKGPGTSAPNTIILGFPSSGTSTFSHPCVLFDISSGVVLDSLNASNDSNFGSSIVDAGNGWWRCSVWGTVTVVGNRLQHGVIRFNNNLNTINGAAYAGNAQSNVYIWGWQFQKALNNTSVLTTQSYTKTTANAGGNGYVTTWYDQSGNTNNLYQTSASAQPQIVSNGSLILRNSKPYIEATSSRYFQFTNELSALSGTSYSFWMTYEKDTSGNQAILLKDAYNYLWLDYGSGQAISKSNSISISSGHAINTLYMINTIVGTSSSSMYRNSLSIGSTGALTSNGEAVYFPSVSGWRTAKITMSEFVYYPTNRETQKVGISANINGYYSIHSPNGSSFVTTWYDQSGNNRNAIQTTSSSQPMIFDSGSLNVVGSKPSLKFDGGDSILVNYTQGTSNEMYFVTETSDTSFIYTSAGSLTYGYVAQSGNSGNIYSNYGTPQLFTNGFLRTVGNRNDIYKILNGYKLSVHKGANLSTWSGNLLFSGYPGYEFNGNLQEWLIYPTLQGSQSQIESNINSYYTLWDSSIVQSGLVMNLDASFKSSYLGSGTTWYDISSSGNNGTLTGSPIYSTANNGIINFDGVNDYLTNGIAISDTMNTIDVWVRMKSTVNGPIIYYGSDQFQSGQWTWGIAVYPTGTHGFNEGPMSYPTSGLYTESVDLNVWKNFTMVRNDNGSVKLYKNGVLVGTKAGSGTTSVRVSTDRLYIAKAGSTYGNFDMGSAKIYNRALSASEILQNFNATKSRFGL